MEYNMNDPILTQAQLRDLFTYDPSTGAFVRKATNAVSSSRQLRVNGHKYLAHRLAWLYVYGAWPTQHIDHINGDPTDNRIDNLRDVSRYGNMQNLRKPMSTNKSGYLGVSRHKDKWCAQITNAGRKVYLGLYPSADAAHTAYLEAKRQFHVTSTI